MSRNLPQHIEEQSAVCGFQWKGEHIHECCVVDEHDEQNRDHICYCGDSTECRFNEESYTPTLPLMDAAEDEIPF